jgi:hypothetical protein
MLSTLPRSGMLRVSTLPLCGVLRWYNRRMSALKFAGYYYYTHP